MRSLLGAAFLAAPCFSSAGSRASLMDLSCYQCFSAGRAPFNEMKSDFATALQRQ